MPRYSFPNAKTGKVMRSKVFDVPGTYTWTVPDGVTEVYLTGCAGGSSGTVYNTLTSAIGGSTSFGSLLSLAGGAGAGGGINGSTDSYASSGGAGYTGGNAGVGANGAPGDGGGGDSSFSQGGAAGEYKRDYPVTVVPRSTIIVTIGSGGVISGGVVGSGGDGLLIVKWNE